MRVTNKKSFRKKPRKKGPVVAKKVTYDGIKFASGLEKYMYIALKQAKIKSKYEGETFVLLNGFHFDNEVYERQANGKGDYSFPMRWKLFKQLVVRQFPGVTLYKPQNQKECDTTVELILQKQKG